MERNYAAFISYRHMKKDTEIASYLHRSIERYRIPSQFQKDGNHFGYVFRDEEELAASTDLSEKIEEALDHSEYLIVVCSKEAAKSVWVGKEIKYFLKHHDYHHVIAVLTEGEPYESFPKALTEITDDEGNVIQVVEPRAADFREDDGRGNKPKRKTEMIRIFATMLGCNFDDLMLRQQKQQRRRILLTSLTVLCILVSFIGMLLYKNRQLENQNEILISQKQEIQYRQSQLLTENAKEELENGDQLQAIRYALDALPDNEDAEQIYEPEAEAVLLSAAKVFDFYSDNHLYLDHTAIQNIGQVDDWTLSEDGKYLAVLNRAAEVNVYDPVSGDVIWTQRANERYRSGISGKLAVDEVHHLLLVQYYRGFCAYQLDSGELVWQKNGSFPVGSTFVISDDHTLLAYIDTTQLTEKNIFYSKYEVVVLNIETGEETSRITLEEEGSIFNYYFKEDINSLAGCFTDDNQLFILAFESDNILRYAVLNLAENKVEKMISDEDNHLYGILDMKANSDGQSFTVMRTHKDTGKFAKIKRYDINGEILSELETPEEKTKTTDYESTYYFPSDYKGVFYVNDVCILYGGEYLYLYHLKENRWISYKHFPSDIVSICNIEEGIQGIILKNGNYYICSVSEDEQYDILTDKQIGESVTARFGNGGYVKILPDEDGEMYASEKDYRENYGVVVTENNEKEIDVYYLRKIDLQMEDKEIIFPETIDEILMTQKVNDRYFYLTRNDSGYEIYFGDKGKPEKIMDFENSSLNKKLLYPDGSGLLNIDYLGTIEKYDFQTKTHETLTEEITEVLSKTETYNYYGSMTRADGVYLADGSVLSVYCDGKKLQWWLNDERQEDIPLPSDLQWGYRGPLEFDCILKACPDGKILFSSYGDHYTMEQFCIYDTVQDTWGYIDDYGKGSDERMIAYGNQKQIFSILEDNLSLCIYDTEQMTLLHQWEAGIPLDDVDVMQFILDDAYLVVGYKEGILQIYDTDDFQLVYETEMYHGSNMMAIKDSNNKRFYLLFPGKGCLCLDTNHWTELAEISFPIWFDKDTDEILYDFLNHYCFRRIPSLYEMIDIIRQQLN